MQLAGVRIFRQYLPGCRLLLGKKTCRFFQSPLELLLLLRQCRDRQWVRDVLRLLMGLHLCDIGATREPWLCVRL